MMDGFYGHGWGMGYWWIIGLVAVALVVWVIARASNQNKRIGNTPDKSSLDILKERYAKGEINKDEFEERKKDLE